MWIVGNLNLNHLFLCNQECIHGTCVSPDMCACEVGWEGMVCDICIPLPGCKYGHCDKALECLCEPGYGGGFCDIRKYFQAFLSESLAC